VKWQLEKGQREDIFKERCIYSILNQNMLCDKQINEVIQIVDMRSTEIYYVVLQFKTE